MATGIDMPYRIVNGRTALSTGARQLAKIIMIAAGPARSTNPWNNAGSDVDLFELDDGPARAKIRRGLNRHFARLEYAGRARLESVSFSSSEGVLSIEIRYTDMVRRQSDSTVVNLPTNGAQ